MLRRFLLPLLLVWTMLPVRAQSTDPFNTSVAFSYLTIDEGLSSNTVRALLQDRMGFVWMGTSRGLNRYDGHRIVSVNKTRALSVTSIVEMGDSLWVGTENGLYLYLQRTDSLQKFAVQDPALSAKSLNVSDMKADKKGDLWIATMGMGILHLENGAWYGTMDFRCPVTADQDQLVRSATEALAGIQVKINTLKKPHHVPADTPLVTGLLAAYEEETGLKGEAMAIGGGTYAKVLRQGVAFGAVFPDEEDLAHLADEYERIESLMTAMRIYANGMIRLAGV